MQFAKGILVANKYIFTVFNLSLTQRIYLTTIHLFCLSTILRTFPCSHNILATARLKLLLLKYLTFRSKLGRTPFSWTHLPEVLDTLDCPLLQIFFFNFGDSLSLSFLLSVLWCLPFFSVISQQGMGNGPFFSHHLNWTRLKSMCFRGVDFRSEQVTQDEAARALKSPSSQSSVIHGWTNDPGHWMWNRIRIFVWTVGSSEHEPRRICCMSAGEKKQFGKTQQKKSLTGRWEGMG